MADTPSHLVLARKWRPDRLSDLVGQEHVTRTLAQALERGRIAHAFLFTGIRGVGKTTAARILARCLNCERGPTAEPCGECAACVEIRGGRALDVSEIDGATYRKIDDARAIIENLSYRPARDRFKIYIIDEAHQLTDQAFNALLKTLEEPPPHVKFILATTEPNKMPETILSRLQRYDFRRIAFAKIVERLSDLARRENVEFEDGAMRLVAREAGGSMRDAERMLEGAIASAGAARLLESEIAASLGTASRGAVFSIVEAIIARNPAAALKVIRELAARGANLESVGRDLLETLRNLAIAKLPADGPNSPLADLPDQEATELRRLSAAVSSRDVMRLFRLMAETQEEILRSPYADLLIEMAVVRMASLAPVMDAEELIRALSGSVPPSGAPGGTSGGPSGGGERRSPPAPNSAPAAGARRMRVEGEVKAEAPRRENPPPAARDMPELRDFIKSRRAALAGFMEQGASMTLDADTLTISPRNDIYVRYLSDNRATVGELASEHFGRPIRAEIGIASTVSVAPSPAASEAKTKPAIETNATETARPPVEPPVRVAMDASTKPASNGSVPKVSDGRRIASPEERAALVAQPSMRRIFDTLDARLVELRVPSRPGDNEDKSN